MTKKTVLLQIDFDGLPEPDSSMPHESAHFEAECIIEDAIREVKLAMQKGLRSGVKVQVGMRSLSY